MNKLLVTSALVFTLTTGSLALAGHQKGDILKSPKMQEALAQLPSEKSTLITQEFEKLKAQREGTRDAMKGERKELRDMLGSADFDKAMYLGKARTLGEKKLKNSMAMHETLANIATSLTVQERQILLKALPKKGKNGKYGKR